MPYPSYRSMTDEDVESLVAYMNTLPPIRNPLPQTNVSFPSSMLMKGLPRPVGRVPPQDVEGGEIYGQYLANVAACVDCHTPTQRLEPDSSMLFAGGRLFATPAGSVNSSNITPEKQTGIGSWNYQRFAKRMHSFNDFGSAGPPPAKPDQYTWMPWEGYAQLTDHDLESLFLYLQALKPIAHGVQLHPGT
jgi:mono/diheme cytochrome c family protein